MALALGVQSGAIEKNPQLALRSRLAQYFQLLVRAIILAGKAEQFEQKRPALAVRRIVPQLRAQGLDGIRQMAGTVKFLWSHHAPTKWKGSRRAPELSCSAEGLPSRKLL